MKHAHVICCNDSIEFVVTGSIEDALAKCTELRKAAYRKYAAAESFAASCHNQYWHIHSVPSDRSD